MAEDLRRFLEDRPIEARRVAFTERLTRWARRNPGLATLGTALAGLLALIVGVVLAADLELRDSTARCSRACNAPSAPRPTRWPSCSNPTLAHARAGRRSGVAGRRSDGLAADRSRRSCWTSRRSAGAEFRNEAIACLALVDLKTRSSFRDRPDDGLLGFDFDPDRPADRPGHPVGRDRRPRRTAGVVARLPGNGLRCRVRAVQPRRPLSSP